MKVHKGDTVLVISGKDKGAKGKVIEAYPTREKVLVEGVNRIKKHTAQSQNERGASPPTPARGSSTRGGTMNTLAADASHLTDHPVRGRLERGAAGAPPGSSPKASPISAATAARRGAGST